VKHIALPGLLALVACGSNPSVIPAGDFSGPSGLAVAPLRDRDLLFVANQGSDELRAMTLCTAPAGPSNTCSPNEDLQFLPAPLRLFAGSIVQVGERPLRLAGAPLLASDNTPHGAVLVVGSDPAVHVIDAAVATQEPGEDVVAEVVASNRNAAHSFPPEVRDLYEAWVELEAIDESGEKALLGRNVRKFEDCLPSH